MASYRRKVGSDTWHFCSNCSNWPDSQYTERAVRPATGEVCKECQDLREKNDCR